MITIEQIIKEDMIIQILIAKKSQVKMQQTQNKNDINTQAFGQRSSKDQYQKQRLQKCKVQRSETFLTICHNQMDSEQNMRKYIGSTLIIGKDALFENWNDLALFFRGKGNYLWDSDDMVLSLFISTVGVDFGRNRKIEIKFQEIEISDKQIIESQNKILRKQLQYFKNQSLNEKNKQQIKYQIKQRYNQDLVQMKAKPEIYSRQDNGQTSLCKLPILLGDRIKMIRNQIQQAEKGQYDDMQVQKTISKKQSRKTLKKRQRRDKNKLQKKILPRKTIAPYNITKLPKKSKSESSSPTNGTKKCFQSKQSMGKCPQKSKIHISGNQYSISFVNDSSYYGQLKLKKFHGKGRFVCKKYTFDGSWKDGKPHGYGVTYYPSGAIEKGFYRIGSRYGKGQDKFDNGQSYVGDFKNQQRNGFGTYYFKNDQHYQGQWKNNLQHGKGIQYFSNGSRFVGTWFNDQKHGQGQNITKQGRTKQIWDNGILVQQIVIVNSESE